MSPNPDTGGNLTVRSVCVSSCPNTGVNKPVGGNDSLCPDFCANSGGNSTVVPKGGGIIPDESGFGFGGGLGGSLGGGGPVL
jgi:hypothetical protein